MKEVKMDILGRVNIPKLYRDTLGMGTDSKVFVDLVGDKVVISKHKLNKICPVCNIVFSDETFTFCPYCGERLIDRPTEEQSKEEQKDEQ